MNEHGTTTAYKRGCRCDICRAASAARQAEYRQRKRDGGPLLPKGPRPIQVHGTRNSYDKYGCRCEPCRDANAFHSRRLAHRRTATTAAQPDINPVYRRVDTRK